MIDLSSVLLPALPPAPAPAMVADGAVASAGSFARTLGQFLDAKDAALEPQPAMVIVPGRQGDAEPGKDLPPETNTDADPPVASVAPFWLASLPVPSPEIAPTAREDGAIGVAQIPQAELPLTNEPTVAPTRDPASMDAPAQQKGPPVMRQISPDILSALQTASQKTLDAGPDVLRPTPPVAAKPVIDLPRVTLETKSGQTTVPVDASAQAIVVSVLPQPAGQVFASARAIAGSWREAARGEGRDQIDAPTSFASAALIDLRERAIVQAAADTAHTALDLTADSGLQRMIDRIETLRDNADAGDTRVRLIPDALGSIDVAVRREGERVHVHFTAEQEATRAVIAEAQPRLTELAAARGVRIGETTVSTGTGGGGATPQPHQPPAPPRAPALAVSETVTLSTDHRLA